LLFRKQYTLKLLLKQRIFIQLKLRCSILFIVKTQQFYPFLFLKYAWKNSIILNRFLNFIQICLKSVFGLAFVECPEMTKNSRKGWLKVCIWPVFCETFSPAVATWIPVEFYQTYTTKLTVMSTWIKPVNLIFITT